MIGYRFNDDGDGFGSSKKHGNDLADQKSKKKTCQKHQRLTSRFYIYKYKEKCYLL